MKIAIVTQYYAPEAIRIPDTLARALTARGHTVRVITGYPNYPDGELFPGYKQRWKHIEVSQGVTIRRVPLFISHSYNPIARFVNYLTFAWSAAAAGRWVRAADVVYVYATQMTPAIGPSLWRLVYRLPYAMHVQDLWPESVTGSSMIGGGFAKKAIAAMLTPWLVYLYKTAAATIAIAPSMATMLLKRGVPEGRIHTVFNWAPTQPAAVGQPSPTEIVSGRTSIIYAGNLGDHQDLDTVLRAANAVKHLPGLTLTFVGSGVAEKRLRALAKELQATNVVFAGRVPAEDMEPIYRSSDYQVVSLQDLDIFDGTVPSKLQSSLSHGVPVITSVRGDVKRLVAENALGFACDPGNVEQLAASFAAASALAPRERRDMAHRARSYYEQHMSIESGVDSIEGVLRDIARVNSKGIWSRA